MNHDSEYLYNRPESSSLSDQDIDDIDEWHQNSTLDTQTTSLGSGETSSIDLRTSEKHSAWKWRIQNFKSSLPTGWRFGAWLATTQAIAVLFLNIAILIWSSIRAGWSSSGSVFQGHCDTVGHVSIGIHLVINVLSTLLLGASNYVMQSLCAPTRNEVDKTHARGSWLDIGVQSLRNLKRQSRSKWTLWLALCFSSIPLHLFYNSTFFSTLSANIYIVQLAQGPDLSNSSTGTLHWYCDPSLYADPEECQDEGVFSSWDILNPSECLNAYATDFLSNRNDVIVVIGTNHTSNGTLFPGGLWPAYMTIQPGSTSFDWICSDPSLEDQWCPSGPNSSLICPDPQFCSSAWKNINPSKWE
ncbi:hypothetical protein GYMLUDRAFT_248272 [Collybiopsis luxurians FD-317 M1]|uniref:DUF6536 domain-containing protein n=1 Tax=Collybiopsis luxurians FD-317 M1 TaxID=944289 RepID=A0A0D0AYR7_9AGAR|nr:hypothetical protein GYMLUDRAFT_248272 [Collybiopsis luxurians FD-317 M1]